MRVAFTRLERNRNLKALIELAKNGNHSIQRETAEPRIANTRKFRIGDARELLCVTRRKLTLIENTDDPRGNNSARLLKACVGSPKVAIHVAATANQLQITFLHFKTSIASVSEAIHCTA